MEGQSVVKAQFKKPVLSSLRNSLLRKNIRFSQRVAFTVSGICFRYKYEMELALLKIAQISYSVI